MRWKIAILLVMLAYPLTQIADVHGAIVSSTKEVDGIIFAISADSQVYQGKPLNVTLSVTGSWNNFFGYLYYNETKFDDMIIPAPDGYAWSETYSISGLDLGCYNLTFEVWYWPKGWPAGWYGPATVSVLVYVVQPPEPTLILKWLTPISKRNSFEAGSKIPIRFSVHDDKTGDFICDKSVKVVVMNAAGQVFFAEYGTHGDDVRIRESAEYYIVDWKTPRTSGLYTISVEFEGIVVDSLQIELR